MSSALPDARRLDYHYIAMQTGFWHVCRRLRLSGRAAHGAGIHQRRGGMLIAVRCLAGIVCQPALGSFADRHPGIPLRRIVSLSLVLSLAASLVFLLFPMGMAGTIAVLVVMGGFEISSYPLMDAMAIQFISLGVPIRYSLGRGIGSFPMRWSAFSWGSGYPLRGWSPPLSPTPCWWPWRSPWSPPIPPAPAGPKVAHEARKPHSVFWLLRQNPAFTVMLLAILLGITGCLPMSNFLVNVVVSRGGTEGIWAPCSSYGGFELPTAFFQRLYRRLGGGRLLLVSILFCFGKALALFLAPKLSSGCFSPSPFKCWAMVSSPPPRSTMSMSPSPRRTG